MNKIQTVAILGLIGLFTTGAASAKTPTSKLYGQKRESIDTTIEGKRVVGYELDANSSEFPAFQNFTFQRDGALHNGAFGMVYRTHRHVRERAENPGKTKVYGNLTTALPLGGTERKVALGTMMNDTVGHSAEFDYFWSGQGFADNVIHRLKAVSGNWTRFSSENLRDLVFAIESEDGTRRRYLFIFKAEEVDTAGLVQGSTWRCTAYDPHAAVTASQEVRFPEITITGWGNVSISGAWARQANAEGSASFVSGPIGQTAALNVEHIGVAGTNISKDDLATIDYSAPGSPHPSDILSFTRHLKDVTSVKSVDAAAVDHGTHDTVASGMPAAE